MHIARVGFHVLVVAVVLVLGMGVPNSALAAPKASIVLDLRNGEVLRARNADRRLHPASLTKMMTLYLTFQAVRDGRLKLDQKIRVSRHAARQPASKLYLRAGQRVSVRSLIRATAIKSANDAAMVLAEAVGGSQKKFARMMTQQAKRLGMKNTAFRNPHGLTQSGHYSSARDMAMLGRHLFFDFPKYYNIFKRRSDYAAGKRIWNTNRLLSTYSGADGIKTGYTRAAGYNLVATAQRGRKHIIAVQFGASSSGDRAKRVARLLDIGFARAKRSVKRTRPTGAGQGRIEIARAPMPRARPGSLGAGRLAVVTQALGPSTAQAATPRVAELPRFAAVTEFAPLRSDSPVARPSRGKAATPPKAGSGQPVPKPRPVRLARDGQLSWAAEVGPFQTEAAALVRLAQLSETGLGAGAQVSRSRSGRQPTGYIIQMMRKTEVDATVICGSLSRLTPGCSVQNVAGSAAAG